MLEPPFDIISCSWPRPVIQENGHWTSEPEWDAPTMPTHPVPQWEPLGSDICWTIDWREYFKSGLRVWERHLCGEMRGFHLVFRLRMRANGTLVFWDDDGCIIRRDGRIEHDDRSAHMLTRHSLTVKVGDCLEVAQWQAIGGWLWGARWAHHDASLRSPKQALEPYRYAAQQQLRQPNGPPLKFFTHGGTPLRAIVSVYSLILNGYRPAEVLLYGEHQWSAQAREWFTFAFPFAQVIGTADALNEISALGGTLRMSAQRHWFVMKALVLFQINFAT